jgi:putative nucleotidyltransferase with HDIG domain
LSAHLFYQVADIDPLALSSVNISVGSLLLPLVLFTISYFLLNSWLIALAISFEDRVSPFALWRSHFAWLSLNYFGGASVAALLVTYTRNLDFTYLAFVLPLLAVLYFTFSMAMGRIEDANLHLKQLNKLYMSTIETLAMAIDAKDQITHGHIRRVQAYALGLAKAVGVTDVPLLKAIEAASLLHDMGKLAVPEYILNKPGPLTPAEFEKMKMHAGVGADILSAIDFPYPVVPIVRHHHEHWNGTGYPDGLAGSNIPIGARILSVVDCFDALTSDRPYRPRLTSKDALQILLERKGVMYDPIVVDTFIRVHEELVASIEPDAGLAMTIRSAPDAATQRAKEREHSLDKIFAGADETLTLFEVARDLASSTESVDVESTIYRHLKRLVPFSLLVLFRFDSTCDELVALHVGSDSPRSINGLRIPRGQRLSGWVAANRKSIRNSDPVLDLGESARALQPPLRSCLSVPITVGDTLVGVLSVYGVNRNSFGEEHERIVEMIGSQVAPVLIRADGGARLPVSSESSGDRRRSTPSYEAPRRAFVLVVQTRLNGASSAVDIEPDHNASVFAILRERLQEFGVLFRQSPGEIIGLLISDSRSQSEFIVRVQQAIASMSLPQDVAVEFAIVSTPNDGDSLDVLLSSARHRLTPISTMSLRPGTRVSTIH